MRRPARTSLIDGPFRVPRLFVLLTLFAVLNFGISTGLVAAVVGLESRKSPVTVWKEHFLGLWLTYLGATFASMLMLVLSHDWRGQPMQPLEVLLLIAPLPVILYVTFRHAVGRAQDQIEHLGGMNRVYVATIEALAQTIDAKDQVTHDHIRRVQENSVRLARELGVTDDGEIQALKAASLLHDVGKISVPEHILNKPGRLTPSELEIMRRHAPVGADILSVIGFPYPVVPIVRHHHENWDGTGYPDGLAGEAIPIGARILMVVDCFDALTSDRPYRPRFETAAALQMIADRRGTMYDPQVVDAFLALHAAGLNEEPPATRAPVADPHATPVVETPVEADSGPRDLAAFYRLGRELAMPGGASEIGQAIWASLGTELGAAACVLFVYDESVDALAPAFRGGADHRGGRRPRGARRSIERLGGRDANTDRQLRRASRRRPGRPRGERAPERAGGAHRQWRAPRRRARLLLRSSGGVHADAPAHGGSRRAAGRRTGLCGARRARTVRSAPGARCNGARPRSPTRSERRSAHAERRSANRSRGACSRSAAR